jgi:hypothetical protein
VTATDTPGVIATTVDQSVPALQRNVGGRKRLRADSLLPESR